VGFERHQRWHRNINIVSITNLEYADNLMLRSWRVPMSYRAYLIVFLGLLAGVQASAKDSIRDLPLPVASFAKQFEQECVSNGNGHVVSNEYYGEILGTRDLNGDGTLDYFTYKCMFGCSEKPLAFKGIGSPCPWGVLLLSGDSAYTEIFVPGMVNDVDAGASLRIAVTRPRSLGDWCKGRFPKSDIQYVYELKEGRFQLSGMCPPTGCKVLLSTITSATKSN
jgi:hypothetical protein